MFLQGLFQGEISTMTGSNLKDFRGLVPGTIENVGKLNPLAIFGGMMQGSESYLYSFRIKR